jgi:hypothetical protein
MFKKIFEYPNVDFYLYKNFLYLLEAEKLFQVTDILSLVKQQVEVAKCKYVLGDENGIVVIKENTGEKYYTSHNNPYNPIEFNTGIDDSCEVHGQQLVNRSFNENFGDEYLGVFDIDKAEYIWKSKQVFSIKKIFGSNIFLAYENHVCSIELQTGKSVWNKSFDNAYLWHTKSIYENAGEILHDPLVINLIGVHENIFWIVLDSGRLVGLDLHTGEIIYNLMHPVKYPAIYNKDLNSDNNILFHKTQLDVEGGMLFGLNQQYYWEIDLTDPVKSFELFDISDECARNKIHPDMPGYEWPVGKVEIYFAEIRSSERNSERNSVGLFNRKTRKIEWAARIGEKGQYAPIVHKMDCYDNLFYAQDGNATLHVFQKVVK